MVLSTCVKRRFFLIGDFDVKKDERRRLAPAQKMKVYELKLAKMTKKKWPKLDLASRTAVTASTQKKKTAKIHDFRSVLREKIDLIETLKIGVFQCGFREKKLKFYVPFV